MREMEALRLAIMKYGCGYWGLIGRHFPMKTQGQLNLQTQRMFGQQSLAEFFRLHLDPKPFFMINVKKTGVNRKQGFIINAGDKLLPKAKKALILENKKKELSSEEYEKIRVPLIREATVQQEGDDQNAQLLLNRLIHIWKAIHLMENTVNKRDDLAALKKKRGYVDNQAEEDITKMRAVYEKQRKEVRLASAKKRRADENAILASSSVSISFPSEVDMEAEEKQTEFSKTMGDYYTECCPSSTKRKGRTGAGSGGNNKRKRIKTSPTASGGP